jgi:hypothetical protein
LCLPAGFFALPTEFSDTQTIQHDGLELLRQAEQTTDILASDVQPFRLTAKIAVFEEKGKKTEGTYTLLWNSSTIWREEFSFPDSKEVYLARINKLLISRNPVAPSEQVYRAERTLDFARFMRLGPKDKVKKLEQRTEDGKPIRRLDISISDLPWKKIYFDVNLPLPTRIEYKGAALGTRYPYKEFDLKFEFVDYLELSGLRFPRSLRRFESNVLKEQIDIQDWSPAKFGEADFVPPDDAHWIRWCHRPQPAILESLPVRPNLQFPLQLRTGGPTSRVVVSGIIGTDGQWHNIETVKSEGNMVDSFWISQMRQQKFSPAKCGDTPVESEMMIEFDWP